MAARVSSIVVGAWLFVTAFLWPHGDRAFTHTWMCGVLAMVLGIISLTQPLVRFGLALLAVYLGLGALLFHAESSATVWNNVLCALAIFVASLLPSREFTSPARLGRHRTTSI